MQNRKRFVTSTLLIGLASLCLETTHGLIRSMSKAPFLFISAIVNRVGHFDDQVAPRDYVQNTAGAHNAGVVIAWLLPQLDK